MSRTYLGLDSETTGVRVFHGDRPFVISGCDDNGKTFYWRTQVNPWDRTILWRDYDFGEIWNTICKYDELVFHNALFDVRMMRESGWAMPEGYHDTMAVMHTLFSHERLALKPLGVRYLQMPDEDEKDLKKAVLSARREAKKKGYAIAEDKDRFGDQPWKADYWLAPDAILKKYAIGDAERTMGLFLLGMDELRQDPRLLKKYEEEMRIVKLTYKMISRGVACDSKVVDFEIARNRMKERLHLRNLAKQAPGLNINAPKQVADFVYKKLGFPIQKFTESGAPSTNSEALAQIDHPVVKELTKAKAAEKANSTFFLRYKHLSVQEGPLKILHPEFNPFGAGTGRYACRNPNLQNVANALNTRSSEPIQARTPFKPRPGCVWLHWDWSQIEMWIFAAEAEEENMLADMATGNLHVATANRLYGKGKDIVSLEMAAGGRSNSKAKAKMMNFGVVFGIGVNSTAEFLKISRSQAKMELHTYYTSYPRIRPYMDDTSRRAAQDGCVWNRFNRKIQIDRNFAYKAVNYIVQSNAADYMKRKMLWLDDYLKTRLRVKGIDAEIVLTIHDEIVVEIVKTANLKQVVLEVSMALEDARGIWKQISKLPVEASITTTNWAEKRSF